MFWSPFHLVFNTFQKFSFCINVLCWCNHFLQYSWHKYFQILLLCLRIFSIKHEDFLQFMFPKSSQKLCKNIFPPFLKSNHIWRKDTINIIQQIMKPRKCCHIIENTLKQLKSQPKYKRCFLKKPTLKVFFIWISESVSN